MEDFYGNFFLENRNFKFFRLQIFSSTKIFFQKYFSNFSTIPRWWVERSERSEPPAGGLALEAEGSVNSELNKLPIIVSCH